jgi:uncharacterized RDD family membrane protein YckC
MSCPVCGEVCHCSGAQPTRDRRLPPRFQISSEAHAEVSAEPLSGTGVLIANEAVSAAETRPRFIIGGGNSYGSFEHLPRSAAHGGDSAPCQQVAVPCGDDCDAVASAEAASGHARGFESIACDERTAPECGAGSFGDDTDWRQEVAARVNKYNSRRKRREPRYPSLRLKFDPPEYSWAAPPSAEPVALGSTAAMHAPKVTVAAPPPVPAVAVQVEQAPAESNIIEFPLLFVPETAPPDQLAEPVFDKPRILEVPEAVPTQAPLGGILLENEEEPAPAKLDVPLPVAPIPMRMLAAAADMVIVLAGMAGFLAIVSHFSKAAAPGREFLLMWVALPCSLWIVYQYAFLVHAGSTPGLRLARLRLARFDGSAPGRAQRRSRALAMVLSAASMGLGFLWSLLDEDTLCWHDRITHTYFTVNPGHTTGFLLRTFGPDSRLHHLLQDRIPHPPVS